MRFNLKNPINWMFILGGISIIFGVLFRIFDIDWMYTAAIIPWAPIALMIGVYIIFAWIINPIRGLIKWIKKKKSEKNVVD